MNRRCLHILLAILVLAQPVASASAWAASMPALADAMEQMAADMPGCHDAAPSVPDCCDDMDGVLCDMDCGTASPALSQAPVAFDLGIQASRFLRQAYAAPQHPPSSLYKPPRIS